VVPADGRRVPYGDISEAAARVVPKVAPTPKPLDQLNVVGTSQRRLDAAAIATGQVRYTMDLPMPAALPTVLTLPALHEADR